MKRYKVLGAAVLLGAVFGSAGTMVVVHTSTIDVAQTILPTPAHCVSVTTQDLINDPVYGKDTALTQALQFAPDDLPFYRCEGSR